MERMTEKWMLQTKKADFGEIAKKFNINPIVARVIRNRDVVGDNEIEEYLKSQMIEIDVQNEDYCSIISDNSDN